MLRRLACLALALWLPACEQPAPGLSTHVDDWRDEVIYQIVVDRFDNGDLANDVIDGVGPEPDDLSRFQGGDWRGIRDRLDYLEHLGVTALWISPPYLNVERTEREDGYHGYWPADFTEANPRFGTLEELRALVQDAHARDMLVILDVVPNHAGRVFSYDLDGDGAASADEIEPAYSATPYDSPLLFTHDVRMWQGGLRFSLLPTHFHRRGAGDTGDAVEKLFGDFPTGLRDLDSESPDVVAALIETHARWVADTDVDGFRIDAVPHAPAELWVGFCAGLRARLAEMGKERFLLLGEVFDARPEVLASHTALDQLDAAFAFDLKATLIDGVILEGRPPSVAVPALTTNRALFPASGQPGGIGLDPWRARVAFGDNHDVYRLRGELDDPLATHLSLTAVFTVDAIPSVYYGTEQELDGRVHHDAREPLFRTAGPSGVVFDETTPTFLHIARLAALRARSVALRHGTLVVRHASTSGGADAEPAPDAGMLAYERHQAPERVLVVLNAALGDSVARFRTGFAEGTRLYDALLATEAPWVVGADGALDIRLPGRAAVVLEAR